MSVVISELEHRPAGEGASDGVPASGAPSEASARIDGEQMIAVLRREASRRARLWAD